MKRMTDFFTKIKPKAEQVTITVKVSVGLPSTPSPSLEPRPSTSSAVNVQYQFLLDLGTIDSGPVRPKLNAYPLTLFSNQQQSFSKSYFEKYDWLEDSIKKDAVFCYDCRMFDTNSSSEDVFIKTGFINWKKQKEKIDKHEKSRSYLTCLEKYRMYEKCKETGNVMSMVFFAYRQEVEKKCLLFK